MNFTVFKDIIGNIHNNNIREFVVDCLKAAPDELNVIPASKKHHPDEACGEGGLIWHIQRACWFGWQFIQSYKWEKDDIRGDIIIAALLLHDIGKQAEYKTYWQYVDHPKTAANMIEQHKGKLPEKVFKLIQGCVLHHMGPFGGKFFMKPIKDYNILEIAVYNADYLSSRRDIQVVLK